MKIRFKGIDQYVAMLEKISTHAEGDMKVAIYKAAGTVAGEIARGLDSLSTGESGLTEEEKKGLIDGFGLSPMQKDKGYINTKAGFAGLSPRKTKGNPNGIPNITLARRIESGTSWMRKQPVIRQATNRAKRKAETEIRTAIEEAIKKRTI